MSHMASKLHSNDAFFFYRGRVALYALLKAMDVGPGDEVILQAFTCLAVPSPIIAVGATPVYVDIDPLTFTMDPTSLKERISTRTKAIIIQHTYGIPSNMDAILALARIYNVHVIEDCCHTFGATYHDQEVGTFGDAAFHSYEWGKPIIIGLGGTAVVNTSDLQQKMLEQYHLFSEPLTRELVTINAQYIAHSILLHPSLYWTIKDTYQFLSKMGLLVGSFRAEEFAGVLSPDYQKRMPESFKRRLFQKLHDLDFIIAYRRWVASQYHAVLGELGYTTFRMNAHYAPVYIKYPLLFHHKAAVLERGREKRIELHNMFLSPIHPLKEKDWHVVGYEKGTCPAAEDISERVIALPIHLKINQKQIEKTRRFLSDMRDYIQI